MKKSVLAISVLLINAVASAGTQTGTVVFQHGQLGSSASSAGYTFFLLVGTPKTNSPGCATIARWVINNDWPAAKIQISTLLAAALSGRQVQVNGSNTCSVFGDTETAIDVLLVD